MTRYVLLALLSCHDHPEIPPRLGNVIELPSIGEAGAMSRRENPRGFGELSTSKGAKRPRSCVEWKLLHQENAEPTNNVEEANDNIARMRCESFDWLARAQPSGRSFVAWNDKLPLAALLAPNAPAEWSDDRLTLRDASTKFVVRPIAWADLNKDGTEDLLLAVSSLDGEGPMTEQRVLAVTRDSDQQPLRALAR